MYAMKYMSKLACIEKDAVRNVLREMDILMGLDHSFLVNLWFTFQDEEDLFVVVDLLLGGDFRYHLNQGIKFSEDVVRIYVGEIAMALEYLRSHRIIHRDIKPDNLLLDTKGHVHLTDFNVATVMEDENTLATSMSGTKPYMAPEIFKTSLGKLRGYSYEVDWWSLGISVFEILRGKRPYHISSNTNLTDIIQIFESTCLMFPSSWSKDFKSLIRQLLHINPKIRINSVEKLKESESMHSVNWDALCKKEIVLPFIPSKDHLNCDPTYELEEMIIEPNPLHKKKKRLAKQNSNKVCTGSVGLTPTQMKLDSLGKKFKPYNREREKIIEQQREKNKCKDEKIPEKEESLELVELQNEVKLNGKTQPNEIKDITRQEERVEDVLKVGDVQQEERVVIETNVERNSFPSETERSVEIPEQRKGLPIEIRSVEIAEQRKDLLNEKERLIGVAEKRKNYPTKDKESSIEVVLQRKSFPNEKERSVEEYGRRKSFPNERERSAEVAGQKKSLPNQKEKLIDVAEKRKSYPAKNRESSIEVALQRKSFPSEREKSTEVAEPSFPNEKERLIEKVDQDKIKDTELEERKETDNVKERAKLRDKESLLQNDKIDVKRDENRVTTV